MLYLSFLLKQSGFNTRQVYIAGLVMGAVGMLLMADWQAIGHDPCREGFPDRQSFVSNDSSLMKVADGQVFSVWQNTTGALDERICEELSTEANPCFWNPHSRVTGQYCAECFKVCRSVKRSLNFVQLCLGLGLLSATAPLLLVTSFVFAADVVPLESQVQSCVCMYQLMFYHRVSFFIAMYLRI